MYSDRRIYRCPWGKGQKEVVQTEQMTLSDVELNFCFMFL